MIQISEFRDLIAIMPVEYQASTSKRSTWEKHMGSDKASDALRSVLMRFVRGTALLCPEATSVVLPTNRIWRSS